MGEDKKLDAVTDGKFKCPKCGYTNDFHLVVDKWGVKAYGRP